MFMGCCPKNSQESKPAVLRPPNLQRKKRKEKKNKSMHGQLRTHAPQTCMQRKTKRKKKKTPLYPARLV